MVHQDCPQLSPKEGKIEDGMSRCMRLMSGRLSVCPGIIRQVLYQGSRVFDGTARDSVQSNGGD
jgi:hypothetical protein